MCLYVEIDIGATQGCPWMPMHAKHCCQPLSGLGERVLLHGVQEEEEAIKVPLIYGSDMTGTLMHTASKPKDTIPLI